MDFKTKIKNSTILREGIIPKGVDVKKKKNRIISIIISFILIAYSLIMTYLKYDKVKETLFNEVLTLDELILIISIVAIIIKAIVTIFQAFMKKSIYALNHFKLYKAIDLIANFDLLILFACNMYNYGTLLDIKNRWTDPSLMNNIKALFLADFKTALLFFVTIIINVPTVLKFLKFSFTRGIFLYLSALLVALSPLFIIIYLNKYESIFYEFEDFDNDYYTARERKITLKHNKARTFFIKFLVLASIFGIAYFISYYFIINLMTANDKSYTWMISFLILGYFGNVLFFFNALINGFKNHQRDLLNKSLAFNNKKGQN